MRGGECKWVGVWLIVHENERELRQCSLQKDTDEVTDNKKRKRIKQLYEIID